MDQVQQMAGAVIVLAATAQVPLRWTAHRFPELRQSFVAIEAILHGNREFMAEESKKSERELRDLIPQLRHRSVKRHSDAVWDQYKKAFASRPLPSFHVLGLHRRRRRIGTGSNVLFSKSST